MAQQTIHTLRQWFSKNNRPKHDQFWDWLDSFWHKDEKIPAEIIDGLKEALDTKLSLSEAELIEAKVDTALDQIVILDGDMPPLRADMEQADATLGSGIAKNGEDITALQHNLDNAWESIYASQEDVETAITNTNTACDAANEAAVEATAAAASANDAAAALPAAIAAKQDKLIAGTGITIAADGRTISSSSGGSEATTIVTYVVDSDAALANWANNAAGNDYSCVLIKPGTWKSSKQIDLTAAGTMVVIGQARSLLEFTDCARGLLYTQVPKDGKYWMRDVNVKITSVVDAFGFHSCTNLTCCTSTCMSTKVPDSAGFHSCSNLTSCEGTGQNTGTGTGYGFYSCSNVLNCTGTGIGTGAHTSTGNDGFGFALCNNLTSCKGTGTGVINGYGFNYCDRLTSCSGAGTSTGTGYSKSDGYGFHVCTSLNSCTATADGTGLSVGFKKCTNLTNCIGRANGPKGGGLGYTYCTNLSHCTGIAVGSYAYGFDFCSNMTNCGGQGTSVVAGLGFMECRVMFGCYPSGASVTSVYRNCYMNKTGKVQLVGDTAVGGYNRTTA